MDLMKVVKIISKKITPKKKDRKPAPKYTIYSQLLIIEVTQ